MAFGDVNLSEEPIRGSYNPGAGGWPTIRYFNTKTGYEGAPYTKKTDKAMCEELGNEEYMQAYVEEAGSTSLCKASDGAGCGEKELGFIAKYHPARMAKYKDHVLKVSTHLPLSLHRHHHRHQGQKN